MNYQYYTPLKDANGVVRTVHPEGEPYESFLNDWGSQTQATKERMEAEFGPLED